MKMIKYDLHTHTYYCDGENAPAEMIQEALKKDFDMIGFSGHAHTDLDKEYSMSIEGTKNYVKDILKLKEDYEGKIDILCALEQDYYSIEPSYDYDYIISSVHYLIKDGKVFSVDESKGKLLTAIDELYGGGAYSLVEDYYALMAEVLKKTGGDIIGHFNLIEKFNSDGNIFDKNNKRYIAAWKSAIEELVKYQKPFEINTGAISRGYMKEPYPNLAMLKYIKQLGGKVIYSGDTHSAKMLGFGMDIAQKAADEVGLGDLFERSPLELISV